MKGSENKLGILIFKTQHIQLNMYSVIQNGTFENIFFFKGGFI